MGFIIIFCTVAWNNDFWPTAVVGEADSVNSLSLSACHIGAPNSKVIQM